MADQLEGVLDLMKQLNEQYNEEYQYRTGLEAGPYNLFSDRTGALAPLPWD
jgi:hypothetical protein